MLAAAPEVKSPLSPFFKGGACPRDSYPFLTKSGMGEFRNDRKSIMRTDIARTIARVDKDRKTDSLGNPTRAAEHYYDYEARFIKQKREQERINILPRVIKPAMFAKGDFALGDMRVFSRYTVAPLSTLTCSFIELIAGAEAAPRRMIPSLIAYIIEGSGDCVQDGVKVSFATGDIMIVPPYTTYQLIAKRKEGFRAWLPQLRLWHGQGLLWRDPMTNGEKESESASDEKMAALFQSRRQVRTRAPGKTRYDWFLSRLADENQVER